MSRPQTRTPGAGRPQRPVAGQPSTMSRTVSANVDDERNLPAFEEGTEASLDTDNVSSGKMSDETATILNAQFKVMDWKRKDGSYPEGARPEVHLAVRYKRSGDAEDKRPYEQLYKYGLSAIFVPTKDGTSVGPRQSAIKPGSSAPKPFKFAPAILFLKSVTDAGLAKATLLKEGTKALEGLTVHVRARKVEGMSEQANEVLMVDFIDGQNSTAPAGNTTSTAPAVQTPDTSEIDALAEQALVDILSTAADNKLTRSTIPTSLIKNETWKAHAQRGAILAKLREDSFIKRESAPWTVDGVNVTLA